MAHANKDIAIVGISIFCPAGESVDEFWQGISRGDDFIIDVPNDVIESEYFDGIGKDIDRLYCKRGGFAKNFKVDPLRFGILPIMADGVDPDQYASMVGVDTALRDAGVFDKDISLQNGSIIIGKGNFSGLIALRCMEIMRMSTELTKMLKIALPALTDEDLDKIKKAYQSKQGRWQPDMAIGLMPSLVASLVANKFDMHGPAYCVDAACASGIVAINHSIELLRNGQCDISVAGGIHSYQSAMFSSAFNLMGALSHRQEISPFSKDADGLLIGQGAGFIVLKTLDKAIRDEDRIYAVIKETAVLSDGGGSHVLVTSVQGETHVMETAWKRAGMDPKTVGLIEAHGTATPVGDRTEITALKEFFGDHTHRRAYVGSVKSNIGHTMPAAGMIGIIKATLALYHRKIPPTLHCEEPLSTMFESRFLPPQEAMDWDGEQVPLIAGVNAFGFGGINSHAILTAYEPKHGGVAPRIKPYLGEALMISAPDKAALIKKLQGGDYTNTGGDYRIIIFDPDEKRIGQAVSIVEKDKPWRGRLDIWFSNKPLLSGGGKIVYLFPGFNLGQVSETDSISDSFGLPRFEDTIRELEAQGETDANHLQNLRTDFMQTSDIKGLEALGVEADIYAGHSIGEWFATAYAGMTTSDVNSSMWEVVSYNEIPDNAPYVAVSGVDRKTAEAWCEQIPNLYLSNDNCPSQVLMCGEPAATDALVALLKREKIYYSVLPYGAGTHTPMMEGKLEYVRDFVKTLTIHEGKVPVWSATTLKPIPTNPEEYLELASGQLTRPVYFRELIEKLYEQENARVFVQIGLGSLIGFVEDTLKGKDFSAVPANLTTQGGADQLRRVLAALFVEGKTVDPNFLGVKLIYQVEHSLLSLPMGAPLTSELPELKEVVEKRYGAAGFALSADGFGGTIGFDTSAASTHPIHQAAAENLRQAMKTQGELTQLFEQSGLATMTAAAMPVDISRPLNTVTTDTVVREQDSPKSFTEPLNLLFEEHTYLLDHAIIRQPKDWPFKENLNAVAPLTMTIELLADIARKHAPGRKLVQIRKITAFKWVAVSEDFEGTVEGIWQGPDHLDLDLVDHAKAEFYFADEWAKPPSEYISDINIGEEILPPIPAEELYDGYAFHGPQYHSATKILKLCARGIANLTEKKAGKGSLLDIMGQQLGMFLHLTQEKDTVSFPVRLAELNFYDDYTDQKGVFEHTLIITRLNDTSIAGNMVLKRDGKIWSVARDFVCQRFSNDRPFWYVSLKPQYHKLASEIAPNVYHFSGANTRANLQALMSKRYIDIEDNKSFQKLKEGRKKLEVLISRIALKDAVRNYVARGKDEMPYPVQIFLHHDENGKPFVRGYKELSEQVDKLHVSLAHKKYDAVAIVAEQPVGIDIEKIEEKEKGFLEIAFTEKERALLKKRNQPEDVIRFWVAKEACGKKMGLGLKGNPKSYEVQEVEGDVLHVGDEKVQTMKIGEEYIVGWTI